VGTFRHQVKPAPPGTRPRNWIFWDCEAYRKRHKDGSETQTLRLGSACYVRDTGGVRNAHIDRWDFDTHEGFWDGVMSRVERDRQTVCIGYNVGYDWRLVDGFHSLVKRGYKLRQPYMSQRVCILGGARGRHKITVLDAMNYFDGSLAAWGDTLDLPKLDIDIDTDDTDSLRIYCRRDVEILRRLWGSWLDFCDQHRAGRFSPTRASQAFSWFCSRHLKHKLYIHASWAAMALERRAYFGGRSEAFRLGNIEGGPFFKLDINSMYPSVMVDSPVPLALKEVYSYVSKTELRAALRSSLVVADVDVQTEDPIYPRVIDGRLCFPVGRFTTSLCTPELRYALHRGHIARVGGMATYRGGKLFQGYVQSLYKLRLKYKSEGNALYASMVKYLLNSLYGKFGQRNTPFKLMANDMGYPDGVDDMSIDDGNGVAIGHQTRIVIAGHMWLSDVKHYKDIIGTDGERIRYNGREEWIHSMPSISAHITSYARVMLWRLLIKAGRDNVYYTDTDSLIVNRDGYDRLAREIDPDKLGKLKLEYKTETLRIDGVKSYKTDTEHHQKGVKASAVDMGDGSYKQDRWQGLRGAIRDGNLDSVTITPMVSNVTNRYTKGVVGSSGSVSPFVLDED
jgi:hypothetical protein